MGQEEYLRHDFIFNIDSHSADVPVTCAGDSKAIVIGATFCPVVNFEVSIARKI